MCNFRIGTLAAFPGQLTRTSLGQSANIGDLYDIRTDRFTGQSVVTGSAETLATNATPMESYQEMSLIGDIVYAKSTSLVNEKDLQLSVLLGLVDHIDITPTNAVFLRTACTLREQVCNVTDIEHLISSHKVTYGSDPATHVVVGIVWGGTVVVYLDRKDTGISPGQSADGSSQHLQMVMSILQSRTQPDSQVLTDVNNSYTINCFSNCLSPGNQLRHPFLEDATALLSNLPQLIHSVNDGKGVPMSFILMPLSSVTSMPTRIEEPFLTQSIAFFRELTETKCNFARLFQYVSGRREYLQNQAFCKIDEFLTAFQKAEKSLYEDVARAVVSVRSGHLDQSRLEDIISAFSRGGYSIDSLRSFLQSLEPVLQKMEFFDKLIHEGIVIIGNSQTDLRRITRDSDVYILYATESAKRQHPGVWKENSSTFLDIVRQEKRQNARTSGNSNVAIFAYVDCDIVRGVKIDRQIAIYRYKHGQVANNDVAREYVLLASLNVAESSQKKQTFTEKPRRRAVVELPCPGASSKCDNNQRIWSCGVCKEQIEYGFDDYFYCSCGKAPMTAFSYKCNGHNHGNDFLVFHPHVLKEQVKFMKPIRELNVLFLGETGVGKSTWINGFANYLSYSTLGEAEAGDSVCLIPSKFTMTNENYEEVEIKTGTDENEDQEVGRSQTKMPKTYVFEHGKIHVRIIDTPGIGDTRGIDYDKKNFQNIMTHISTLDEINGICILLKPNNARLTVLFKFCIKELLAHLHRDASKNIVFCFTNARGTFYKPGDTLPALKKLIADSTDIDLQLGRETIYCIDNESVRLLAAVKQGVKFSEEEKKNYSTSWEVSVKETERLIDYISSLPPHKVRNTVSLNDARRLILALSRPLAEITSTIQNNIGVVEDRRQEILESKEHKKDLTSKLYIPVIDLKTTPLDYPRTVCTARSCVKHISFGGVDKIDYVRHCHEHCYLTGVETNIVNCVALQRCAAMDGKPQCQQCSCSWSVHMHITYDCTQVERQIVDENVQRQIRDKDTSIGKTQRHLQTLQDRINTLEAEKRKVAKVSAKFGCFLKHNAIVPYNDAISDYLDHLIEDEKGKVSVGGNRSRLDGLNRMKSMYEEEMKVLEQAINGEKNSVHVPTAEQIKRLYDYLCHLQITGPMLKDVMKVAEDGNAGVVQYNEKRIHAHRKPPYHDRSGSQPQRSVAGRIGGFIGRIWRP